MKEGNRNKKVTIRFTEQENEKLDEKFAKTTSPNLSEYLRNILMNRPVTMRYRNDSLDDLIDELSGLRRELNSIGNNFNQAVKKLHTLRVIPEFRNWLARNESLLQAINEQQIKIKEHITQIADRWSQGSEQENQ